MWRMSAKRRLKRKKEKRVYSPELCDFTCNTQTQACARTQQTQTRAYAGTRAQTQEEAAREEGCGGELQRYE